MARNDYSWSETALNFGATLTLAVMAVTSFLLRYVTDPVTCFTPAQFVASHNAYTRQVCYDTQRIFSTATLGGEGLPNVRQTAQFTYHQWVPFFLGVAAILCLLPHVIWRMLSGFLWLDAHALVQTVADNQRQNAAGRHVMLHDSALLLQAGLKGGNYILTIAALGRKLLVCGVCFIQLILMAVVFAPDLSITNGDEDETRDEDTNSSIPLPLHPFLCDYSVRSRGNVHMYTHMCVMPLAQGYSKGLTFLTYFFLVLFLLCALDIAVWAGRLVIPGLRDVALQRYLSVISQSENDSQQRSAHFARFLQSLGVDGRLLLAVIADHCGPLAAADLTNHLWLVFKDTPRPGPAPSTCPDSASASQPNNNLPSSTEGAAVGSSGDAGSIPMVTIGEGDGDAATKDDEKGKLC